MKTKQVPQIESDWKCYRCNGKGKVEMLATDQKFFVVGCPACELGKNQNIHEINPQNKRINKAKVILKNGKGSKKIISGLYCQKDLKNKVGNKIDKGEV